MDEQLADRLATVERAVTDGETDLENVVEGAATADRVADLERQVADLEDEVAELDAATQALRGYVGEVRAVNEEVEETAAAAMAKAEGATRTGDGGSATRAVEGVADDRSGAGVATDGTTAPSSDPASAAAAETETAGPAACERRSARQNPEAPGHQAAAACPTCGRDDRRGTGPLEDHDRPDREEARDGTGGRIDRNGTADYAGDGVAARSAGHSSTGPLAEAASAPRGEGRERGDPAPPGGPGDREEAERGVLARVRDLL